MLVLPYLPDMLAYIDPGAGSLVLQVLVGGILGLAVTARLYWARLMTTFRGKDASAAKQGLPEKPTE
jgi:hypothetical protein